MDRLAEIERHHWTCGPRFLKHWGYDDVQWLVTHVKRYREALENIKAQSGPVCPEFEVCTHATCNASAGAHLIALEALKDAN